MKIKYRIYESQYSDDSVRFFPQSYDWWHGWRFYAYSQWSNFSNHGPGVTIWFDTLEEAKAFLDREIEWRKTNDTKKDGSKGGYVYRVKEIIHNYDKEKAH